MEVFVVMCFRAELLGLHDLGFDGEAGDEVGLGF